jgi:hypothetical protein
MTTQADDGQFNATSDLPAIPVTSPPAAVETPASGTVLTGTVRPVTPNRAEQARQRRLEDRTRRLLVGAEQRLRSRVRDPDGGDSAASDILEQEKALRARIRGEKEEGSRKHDRLPLSLRRIPLYVLGFDSALLIYFFAGITNVDWTSPLSFALAVAVILASMVTLLAYGCLTFAGYRLRGHKTEEGRINWGESDALARVALGTSIVVIAVIAALMFLRMRTEVLYALGTQAQLTALVIGLALAVVSAAANLLVIAIHAADGSHETASLDRQSAAIRRLYAKAERMRARAAQQD